MMRLSAIVLVSCSTLFLLGCNGNLRCSFVNTGMNDIAVEPTDARVISMDCTECYWWVDDAGRLNIAGRGIVKSLINARYDREFYLSFVLDEPSKGMGKNFGLGANSGRGLIKSGGNIYRLQTTYGILGSENRKSDVIVAAYRTNISLHAAKFFGGWSKPHPFVIFGTLTAVPDRNNMGQEIRRRTEEEGFDRKLPSLRKNPPLTTTQPTRIK